MKIKIKKLKENAVIPKIIIEGDAAFDLYATEEGQVMAGQTCLCDLGFAVEIPSGYCMKIIPRSGLALKYGITIINSPGLIDSTYRDSVGVILTMIGRVGIFGIEPGDRIAQGRIEKNIEVEFEEVEELSETDRKGGFGSTGK